MESLTPQNEPAKSKTLFSISDEISQLNTLLDELEADDAESEKLLTEFLEQVGEERDHKLDNYSALIAELEARAAVRKEEAKRLAQLAAKDEKRAEMLKERLKWFFSVNNIKKLETNRYQLSLVKNGGKPPVILDESISPTELPKQFQKLNVEADKTAIREALLAGEELDFAHLGDRGTSIRIR